MQSSNSTYLYIHLVRLLLEFLYTAHQTRLLDWAGLLHLLFPTRRAQFMSWPKIYNKWDVMKPGKGKWKFRGRCLGFEMCTEGVLYVVLEIRSHFSSFFWHLRGNHVPPRCPLGRPAPALQTPFPTYGVAIGVAPFLRPRVLRLGLTRSPRS